MMGGDVERAQLLDGVELESFGCIGVGAAKRISPISHHVT
jgi:hypothetical protein